MGLGTQAMNGMAQSANLVMILLLVVVIGVTTFFIIQLLTYKHRFRIREIVNGRTIVIDDRAREYKDKEDGNTYWQLLKLKQKIQIPPPEAIDITNKGKKVVEAYRGSTGEFVYIQDTGDAKEPFNSLTTNQRLLMINQIKKAQGRKIKDWKENLPQMVFVGAVVIVLVCLMLFWGEIAQPAIQAGGQVEQMARLNKETVEILKEIKNDVQTIKGDEGTPTLPN